MIKQPATHQPKRSHLQVITHLRLLALITSVAVVIFVCRPLLANQLLNTDDGEFQAARAANYYLAFKQGQMPVRWAPNLSFGYGYPVFLFIYHLPYMAITGLYMLVNIPFQLAMNLVFLGSMMSGVIGMWILAQQRSLSPWPAAIVAWLYAFSPYSLINVFLRGALGEVVFFGLLPWTFVILTPLARTFHPTRLNAIAIPLLAALLLTHQMSLLLAVPLLITYVILIRQEARQAITWRWLAQMGILAGLSFLLVAWFWLPAIWEKQFIILDSHSTVTQYWLEFLQPIKLLFPKLWGGNIMTTKDVVAIGYPSLIVSLVTLWLIKTRRHSRAMIFWSSWFALGLLLMMPFSKPVWSALPTLQYLQFPWRLLWLTTYASCMLLIEIWPKLPTKQTKYLLTAILGIFLTASVFNHARYRGLQQWPDYELLEYFKYASSYNEHQPIWASAYTAQYPNTKLSFRKPGEAYFVDEQPNPAPYATSTEQSWSGSSMTYTVDTTQSVDVIQKTYYFPGWQVRLDGAQVPINYTDPELPGHLIFTVPPGKHEIQTVFTNHTPMRKLGDSLFWVGLVASSLYIGGLFLSQKTKLKHEVMT